MSKKVKTKHTNLRLDENMFNRILEIQMKEVRQKNKVINFSDIIRELLNIGIQSYEKK